MTCIVCGPCRGYASGPDITLDNVMQWEGTNDRDRIRNLRICATRGIIVA